MQLLFLPALSPPRADGLDGVDILTPVETVNDSLHLKKLPSQTTGSDLDCVKGRVARWG